MVLSGVSGWKVEEKKRFRFHISCLQMVNRCTLHKMSEEPADRILIHCDKTKALWAMIRTASVVWVFRIQ